MTFNEVLSQTIAMLHQHGRVSYRAMKQQFGHDDDDLAGLTEALLFAHPRLSMCATVATAKRSGSSRHSTR